MSPYDDNWLGEPEPLVVFPLCPACRAPQPFEGTCVFCAMERAEREVDERMSQRAAWERAARRYART